jgi:hypothetical protein
MYQAIHSFWAAREAAIGAGVGRRDSYTVTFFHKKVKHVIKNDQQSLPDELLDKIMDVTAQEHTDFGCWMDSAEYWMEHFWDPERFVA